MLSQLPIVSPPGGVRRYVVHFLVQCPHYNDARIKLWEALNGIDAAAAAATQQLPEEEQALALLADTMWPANR